jgi:hypothetical protein
VGPASCRIGQGQMKRHAGMLHRIHGMFRRSGTLGSHIFPLSLLSSEQDNVYIFLIKLMQLLGL